MNDENKRAAINMSVSLSTHLTTAALAMLTIEGAYIAFVFGQRKIDIFFYVCAFLSALSFIASIYFSGKAITETRNAGFQGSWDLDKGKGLFNLQAILCTCGLVLFIPTIFFSLEPKKLPYLDNISQIENKIGAISSNLSSISSEINSIVGAFSMSKKVVKDIDDINKSIKVLDEINKRLNNIEKNVSDLEIKYSNLNTTVEDLDKDKSK